MQIQDFSIKGPLLIKPKVFRDDRGFFTERYKLNETKSLGLPDFVQDNFSRSIPGVLRGLHYQWDQPQSKLVTVLSGKILDIAVDIRKTSPTYGQHTSVILDGQEPAWFWIPAGFAHGFCVLENQAADLLYKTDCYYNPQGENGIHWNDPDLKINWLQKNENEAMIDPKKALTFHLSHKDNALQLFKEYSANPRF